MKIADKLFENSVQIEKIIWLAGQHAHPSELLVDAIEMDLFDELKELVGIGFPRFVGDGAKEDDEEDDMIFQNFKEALEDWLTQVARANKEGFLVHVYTPVPLSFSEVSMSASWGYTQGHWFYTESLNDAFVDVVMNWRAQYINDKKKTLVNG